MLGEVFLGLMVVAIGLVLAAWVVFLMFAVTQDQHEHGSHKPGGPQPGR